MKITLNIVLWTALIVVGAPIFGSPAGVFPDRASMAAAVVLAALIAVGLGFATVDCNYLFRCL